MGNILNSVRDNLKKQSLGKIIARLLYCLMTVNIASLVTNKDIKFFDKTFFTTVTFSDTVLYAVLMFVLCTAIFLITENDRLEKLLLLVTYFVYAAICVVQNNDLWFYVGVMLGLLAVSAYVFGDEQTSPLHWHLPTWSTVALVAACGLVFAVWIGVQTSFRVLTQLTPSFDFGIFAQMYYNMKETLLPITTVERDVALSHFAIHVSPIYYLFLPFYALFPDPVTLEICQAVMLASGVIPVYMLCKKVGLSNKATVAFAICYAFYPALSGGCYYDLHENKFLAPLLLWLFYFIESNKWWGVITFSLLTCFVKEDAPVYVVFAALYVLASGKDRKKGLAMLSGALMYFGGVIFYLENYGYAGVMSSRFSNFIFEKDGGLLSVVKAVIMSPFNVVKECFELNSPGKNDPSKVDFIVKMMAPLGFLPAVTRKASRYILLCPMILVNLMPDYVYQHTIDFQYTYGAMAFLVYAAIINYRDFTPKSKRIAGVFAACSALLLYASYMPGKANYAEMYSQSAEKHREVRQALSEIPEDASVQASTFLVTQCSSRAEVYDRDHYDKKTYYGDYVAIDLRYGDNRTEYKEEYKDNPDYELVHYLEGRLALLKYIGG